MQTTASIATRNLNLDMGLAAPNDHRREANNVIMPAPTPEAPPAPAPAPAPTETPAETTPEVALSDEVVAREAKKAKMRALMFS